MMSEHETEAAPEGTLAAEETPAVPVPVVGEREEDHADPESGAPGDDADAATAKPRQHGRPRFKLEDLRPGQAYHGKVVGLAKFGAFVDIGAVTDGLVHLTEFSGKRVRKVEDVVSQGDEVDVWIKEIDLVGNRISLSMRKKPMHSIKELHAGDVLTGVVTSTTEYGVFVDIGSETEGLVHISEISSGYVQKPSDVVKAGDAVEVRVKEIDLGRERISLSMVGLANDLGLEAGMPAAQPMVENEAADAEPEERLPTVVELALRRALGEADDEDEEEADDEPGEDAARESLGEIYERMLAEYRASKDQA